MNKFWYVIFLLPGFVCSQIQNTLDFEFYNPKIKLYVIGENHFEDNTELQVSVVQYLDKNAQINTIISELPQQVGVVINDYVLNGAQKEEMLGLLGLLTNPSPLIAVLNMCGNKIHMLKMGTKFNFGPLTDTSSGTCRVH